MSPHVSFQARYPVTIRVTERALSQGFSLAIYYPIERWRRVRGEVTELNKRHKSWMLIMELKLDVSCRY
jgi:hypothetical protein